MVLPLQTLAIIAYYSPSRSGLSSTCRLFVKKKKKKWILVTMVPSCLTLTTYERVHSPGTFSTPPHPPPWTLVWKLTWIFLFYFYILIWACECAYLYYQKMYNCILYCLNVVQIKLTIIKIWHSHWERCSLVKKKIQKTDTIGNGIILLHVACHLDHIQRL